MKSGAADWFSAAYAPPVKMLGFWLRPYSVGHEVLLRLFSGQHEGVRIRSPDDLILACLVCACDYRNGLRLGRAWWLPLFLRLWRWRLGNVNWPAEAARFETWRESSTWVPEAKSSGKPAEGPGIFRVLAFLMGRMNKTEAEALDYPIGRANILIYSWGEMHGSVDLIGKEVDTLFERLDAMENEDVEELLRKAEQLGEEVVE